MNCEECREESAAYLEGLLDEASQSQIESHVVECSTCQAELEEVRQLTIELAGAGRASAAPPVSLETAVMDRILREQALQLRKLKMRKRIRVLGISGALAAAAAFFLVSNLWFTQSAEAQKAAEVLARGAEAVPNPSTVHIVAKMRTPPGDNFAVIDPNLDFVLIEVWKQFGDRPKWRVDEPGRVAVMDGTSTLQLMRPNIAIKIPHASNNWGPVLELANVQDMITRELRTAQAKGWDLKLAHETTPAGEKKLLVTVEAKAGVPNSDYLKNKYLDLSDVRCVYQFDAKTQRLERMEAYLHQPSGEVLVLTIERIEYDHPIDPAMFAIKLPEDVQWIKEAQRLPGQREV